MLYGSMLHWRRGVHLPCVSVYSALCETYGVEWCSMDLWSISRGGVMVLHRSMLNWRRGWDQSAISICAFFYM